MGFVVTGIFYYRSVNGILINNKRSAKNANRNSLGHEEQKIEIQQGTLEFGRSCLWRNKLCDDLFNKINYEIVSFIKEIESVIGM